MEKISSVKYVVKKRGFGCSWLFRGYATTHLYIYIYRVYFIKLMYYEIRIPINQPGFYGSSLVVLFFNAQIFFWCKLYSHYETDGPLYA